MNTDKKYCEKIVITDDPATWPTKVEILYDEKGLNPYHHLTESDSNYPRGRWWLKPIDLDAKYKEWCKATGRNGGILVHGSIQEFFKWLKEEEK